MRKPSRQLRYQHRRVEKDLCRECGAPRFRDTTHCRLHYTRARLVQMGLFAGSKFNPWVAKRDKLLAHAAGVLAGAEQRTRRPFEGWEQAATEVVVRHFKSTPKGPRLKKFARWLAKWDRRLRRD